MRPGGEGKAYGGWQCLQDSGDWPFRSGNDLRGAVFAASPGFLTTESKDNGAGLTGLAALLAGAPSFFGKNTDEQERARTGKDWKTIRTGSLCSSLSSL